MDDAPECIASQLMPLPLLTIRPMQLLVPIHHYRTTVVSVWTYLLVVPAYPNDVLLPKLVMETYDSQIYWRALSSLFRADSEINASVDFVVYLTTCITS